jgi:hypothetical protein
MRKEFLLGCTHGEPYMMEHMFMLTEKNIYTKKPQWCISCPEFDVHPFGKLLKEAAKYHLKSGKVKTHAKYHHGFYMNVNCTEEFYNKYKTKFDEFSIKEDWILESSQPPVWL